MPILTTRSVFSAKAFGALKGKSGVLPSGNLGMFIRSLSGSQPLTQYVFASDTISNGISSGLAAAPPAFSNNSRGIVGQTTSQWSNWTWSPQTLVSGSAYGQNTGGACATGDKTRAFIALGGSTVNTGIFTYSSFSMASGAALQTTITNGAAVGSATAGIYARGNATTATNKWVYSSGATSVSTALSGNSLRGAGTGNATVGIIALGNGTSNTSKWTFSNDGVTPGAALVITTSTSTYTKAAGNGTVGIYINNTVNTSKYVYSNDSSVSGATFTSTLGSAGCAISNGVPGVSAP